MKLRQYNKSDQHNNTTGVTCSLQNAVYSFQKYQNLNLNNNRTGKSLMISNIRCLTGQLVTTTCISRFLAQIPLYNVHSHTSYANSHKGNSSLYPPCPTYPQHYITGDQASHFHLQLPERLFQHATLCV